MSNIPSHLTPLQKRYLALQIKKNNLERLNNLGLKNNTLKQDDSNDTNKMKEILDNRQIKNQNNEENKVYNMVEPVLKEQPSKINTNDGIIERINDKIETYNLRYQTRFKQMNKTFDEHKEILTEYLEFKKTCEINIGELKKENIVLKREKNELIAKCDNLVSKIENLENEKKTISDDIVEIKEKLQLLTAKPESCETETSTQEPVPEEPVPEEPVSEEPVSQEPVPEEPVSEEPASEEENSDLLENENISLEVKD